MSITIQVNGTVNTLVHKFSSGISVATIPDVCKTPSPGGPVPIPYPNIAQSITLSDGTTSVRGDKTMAAVKGSKFALSNGDNAGVAGGVKSSTFMKEATWILYSFDVKLNKKNAARLTDKMFHNHENAANLAGVVQALGGVTDADLQKLAEDCNDAINRKAGYSPSNPPKGKACTALGSSKHQCCEDSINEYNKKNPNSPLRSEVAFNRQGQALEGVARKARDEARKVYETSVALVGRSLVRRWGDVFKNALKAAGGMGNFVADVLVLKDPKLPITKDNIAKAIDFKFNCGGKGKMSNKQQRAYGRYTGDGQPTVIHSAWNKAGKVVSSVTKLPALPPLPV
ncbi:DUF4150 domain-containing protein [Roseateles sp. UC29_93]|uniref:DUF4150 domain-containing protein n=1 Tax=Roseateles sp. UC29_93 TaxID=3350177 RepID=UPI00366FA824